MQVGKKKIFFNDKTSGFLDPDTCKNYIRHSSKNDTAIIKITTIAPNSGGPWNIQFIMKPLDDLGQDRKAFSMRNANNGHLWCGAIYGGWWRYGFSTTCNIHTRVAYEHEDLGLKVIQQKYDWRADAVNGRILVNGQNFRDVSTKKSSLPDTTYYWIGDWGGWFPEDLDKQVVTQIEMMGFETYHTGNLYYNFYALRVWDKTGKLFCDLIPKQQDGVAGLYDNCTNLFWTKTHNVGSFVFGTDP